MVAVSFPTMDGRFDYLGFASTDEKAHEWCRDLFERLWESAEEKRDFGWLQAG